MPYCHYYREILLKTKLKGFINLFHESFHGLGENSKQVLPTITPPLKRHFLVGNTCIGI